MTAQPALQLWGACLVEVQPVAQVLTLHVLLEVGHGLPLAVDQELCNNVDVSSMSALMALALQWQGQCAGH